ncbi:MAG TPA: molybdopterin molybdenumtransferase MoeA, partial [Pseudomonadaceae bacterium]|nr:molybdopterin molybdenumtransferase MoeA [Pseudomonadaceae bacterium]
MAVLMPVHEALEYVLKALDAVTGVERLPLPAALGRVLAHDQEAGIDVPAYDNSAMDGYALRCADVSAVGAVLPQSQTIAAGHPGSPLQAGTMARIFTGAPVPLGADTVLMQENCRPEADGIRILELPRLGQNIRRQGHDVRAGTRILEAGRV